MSTSRAISWYEQLYATGAWIYLACVIPSIIAAAYLQMLTSRKRKRTRR